MNQVKNRNMGLQVLLVIVTFGIYIIYWFYQTATELKAVTKNAEAAPTLWTILLFIPIGNIYSYFMYSELYEKVCSEKINKWILLVLWIFFSPAIWFLVQRDLNRIAVQPAAA
ncbi:MAG: DUF4234 domain-containing protein [Pseudobdellovibrio sp.]